MLALAATLTLPMYGRGDLKLQLLQAPPAQPFHVMYFLRLTGMVDNWRIWLLVWTVVIDIVTGFAKSLVTHHTTSTKGTDGLIKHGVLLLVILTLYPIMDVNGYRTAADAFVSFYILFYATSIVENWGQMGLPLPSWLKPYIYKLSDDYNDKSHINRKGNDKDA